MNRLILVVAAALLLPACSNTLPSADSYSRNETKRLMRVRYAEVIDIRPVKIDGEAGFIGETGGAAVGYTVGRTIGDGSGSRVAGAVGGVAGAVAGTAIETKLTEQDGYAITVRLDSGREIVIVQPADVAFGPGERVRVLTSSGGRARVEKTR